MSHLKVLKAADKYGMLEGAGHVLCALSGGADSVCMTKALCMLAKDRGFKVSAAHFNHRLRDEESDRDEIFCRAFCEKLGIKLYVGSANVKEDAERSGEGIEEAARRLRYAFLRTAAKECEADRIATAHTADDNLETIIMNLARGSGIHGLCGIPPVRGDIIRPIIFATRVDVMEFIEENGLEFVTDSTNLSNDYTRNMVRNIIVPRLKDINENAARTVSNAGELLREDAAFIEGIAKDVFERICGRDEGGIFADIRELKRLDPAIKKRIIRMMYGTMEGNCGKTLSYAHVSAVEDVMDGACPSARADLPGNVSAYREYDRLIFRKKEEEKEDHTCGEIKIEEDGTAFWGGFQIKTKKIKKSEEIYNSLNTFCLDLSRISGSIVVRARMEGDEIKLSGRGTKTLKKLMIEEKIPREKRDKIPVIADVEKVLAVYGVGVSASAAAQDGSDAILIEVGGTLG